jgi:superfamily I DNA/RNA helicase
VAGDDQQAVFANRRGSPLVELATLTLDANLRNTRQIAHVFNPLGHTSMDLRGGEGAPVRFIDAPTDEVHSRAEELVEELLDAGYDAGDIAVLTTQHRHVYHREQENLVGKDGYWDGFWMDEEVFYGTVMGFKGLERPVVILAVDGFHDGVARDVMYAGMSRARDELIVIGDPDQISAAVGKVVAKRLFP